MQLSSFICKVNFLQNFHEKSLGIIFRGFFHLSEGIHALFYEFTENFLGFRF